LLEYLNTLEELKIGPEGQLSKLERVSAALNFLKMTKRITTEMIQDTELHIQQWKRTLRSQKSSLQVKRIEEVSEMNLSMDQITQVVDNQEMWGRYDKTMKRFKKHQEVTESEQKIALATIMTCIMLKSSQRPGAVTNCTIAEYRAATTTSDGTTVIKVFNHKTGQQGTAKLTLDTQLHQRLNNYFNYMRPLLAQPGNDIDELFILPGSTKVRKFSNLETLLKRTLKIDIPSATMARKIGATCAARCLDYQTNQLITKQMSHQPHVSAMYYEAVRGIDDSAKAFQCMESLRTGKPQPHESHADKPPDSVASPNVKGNRWTTQETQTVMKKFRRAIEAGKTPELQECATLELGKTPKQIQDKVRTVIRQNARLS
jgi:hypothetical protein